MLLLLFLQDRDNLRFFLPCVYLKIFTWVTQWTGTNKYTHTRTLFKIKIGEFFILVIFIYLAFK